MLIWSPVSDFPATVGQGLPQGQTAIIGHEAMIGFGHLWLLSDVRGVLIDAGVAESVDAAQDQIVARAMVFSKEERKPGRPSSALRGTNSFNRNHRRNVRIAALHKANQIVQDRIERLYWDNRFETVDEIRGQLQVILCDMAIIALAESVRRYSTIFERYFELPPSVVRAISKSIKSRADQIDGLASGPMAEQTPDHEMVLKHLQHVAQRLEEIITSLRREGFLIDNELRKMAQGYCTPRLANSVPLNSLTTAKDQTKEHFLLESQEIQDELISRLMAAQFQFEQWMMGGDEEDEADLNFDEKMKSEHQFDDEF